MSAPVEGRPLLVVEIGAEATTMSVEDVAKAALDDVPGAASVTALPSPAVSLEEAERALSRVQSAVDSMRAAEARRLLSLAFPRHSTAVFVRDWDEDRPRLVQLLSTEDGVDDVDLTADPEARLPEGSSGAFWKAEHFVCMIAAGGDEAVWAQPGFDGEYITTHDGWVEFDLALGLAPGVD